MSERKIIHIDAGKCNGCGLCIPNCPEGAIQIIDGKARLVSDLFCDGLGACLGHCPQGAITIEEREAQKYNERKVMENIVKQGENVIRAHLEHLESHRQAEYLKEATEYLKEKGITVHSDSRQEHAHSGCPGSKIVDLKKKEAETSGDSAVVAGASQLANWPVQIKLVPAFAPYLNNADLLIAADCVPFAYAGFHQDLLKGKVLLVGCPKLDDINLYKEKFIQILKNNQIKSITYAHMQVPCCFGMVPVIQEAIESCGKNIPFQEVTVSIQGEKI
jgi:ferredoxin